METGNTWFDFGAEFRGGVGQCSDLAAAGHPQLGTLGTAGLPQAVLLGAAGCSAHPPCSQGVTRDHQHTQFAGN